MLLLEVLEKPLKSILDFIGAWKFLEKNFFDESASNQFTTGISK